MATAHAVQSGDKTTLEASRPQVRVPALLLLLPCLPYPDQPARKWRRRLQDELVLVEHSTDAGDVVQIVYRNGGLVDANALESLCDKVHQVKKSP